MRYFMEVLILVIGVTLADPVPEAAAAFNTHKSKTSSYRKRTATGPIDVWARIRSGMGIFYPPAADQAADRSGSSGGIFETRRHFEGERHASSIPILADSPQTAPVSRFDGLESDPPKLAPTRYTALGRKLFGVKASAAAAAGGAQPTAGRRRGHTVSRNNKKTALLVRKANRSEKQPRPARHQSKHAEIDLRIEKFIAAYARNPDFLYRVAERARPYLYHIVEALSEYRLPLELALLPIIESAYLPTAESPKNARGLWQFIPGTGIDYDLVQSRDYDERLDIPKSTQAAIRFLSGLYRHFNGDWLLALAAYNAGQAAVDKAVSHNRAKGLSADFWSLRLPAETSEYVPRLLALSAIFAYPDRYGIQLPSVKNEPYFVKVNIAHESEVSYLAEKKIAAIAGLADLPPDQFRRLNPGYLGTSLSRQRSYLFLLPPDNAVRLRRHLAGLSRFRQAPRLAGKVGHAAEKPPSTDLYAPAPPLAGDPEAGSISGKSKSAVPLLSLGADGDRRLMTETGGF
jgi:soluble lytic murein transglycosylase-like protein